MTEREDQAMPPAEEPGDENRVAQPPDVDAFRLRGEPPRVMRLSRKTLVSIGAAGEIAIGGALLWALQPSALKSSDNLYSADTANRAEVVTGAPADYGKVPKLGPPLPGDLGRPIVAAQRDGEIVPVPPMGSPSTGTGSPADEARDRARQEREAATTSRLFLGGQSAGAGAAQALRGSIEPAVAAPAPVAGERFRTRRAVPFSKAAPANRTKVPNVLADPARPTSSRAGASSRRR